jgi:hypothetical protein
MYRTHKLKKLLKILNKSLIFFQCYITHVKKFKFHYLFLYGNTHHPPIFRFLGAEPRITNSPLLKTLKLRRQYHALFGKLVTQHGGDDRSDWHAAPRALQFVAWMVGQRGACSPPKEWHVSAAVSTGLFGRCWAARNSAGFDCEVILGGSALGLASVV